MATRTNEMAAVRRGGSSFEADCARTAQLTSNEQSFRPDPQGIRVL